VETIFVLTIMEANAVVLVGSVSNEERKRAESD